MSGKGFAFEDSVRYSANRLGIPADKVVEFCNLRQAVQEFAVEMLERLAEKLVEGKSGWDELMQEMTLASALQDEVVAVMRDESGHEVDAANYLMFLWHLSRSRAKKEVAPIPEQMGKDDAPSL